jgi:hypothetical protein
MNFIQIFIAVFFSNTGLQSDVILLSWNQVANGGYVFRNYNPTPDGMTTVSFINKRIPNTVLTLYNPSGIIGRSLAVGLEETAVNPGIYLCGDIIAIP